MSGLGRIVQPDIRDHGFLLRTLVDPTKVLDAPAEVFWDLGPILNQGNTPQCVGYGWRQFLSSAPLMTTTGPSAPEIYHRAQELDDTPGTDYEGTTVRAGAKTLSELGHLASYFWGYTLQDITDFLRTEGPVVVGTDWLAGMDDPIDGTIFARGAVRGGHCYVLGGCDMTRQRLRLVNSWGPSWADGGCAWISFADFQILLNENGEACFGVEKVVGSDPIPEPQPARSGCLPGLFGWIRQTRKS